MVEAAIMIEGQNGLDWPRWQRIARAVEDLGYAGLYRSDHYTNPQTPDLDSLELWTSLTWLASHTQRIEFGPLVTPTSFRHPTHTARMAAAVDDLSGGRLILGVGAGWQEREHQNYGWDLLPVPERFARFEESLQVITYLLRSDVPVDFDGKYYHLHDAILLPRPARRLGPPILIGGNGEKRTLPLAARYADEWNGNFIPAEEYARLNDRLTELIREAHREPEEVRRSIMVGTVFGTNPQEVEEKVKARTHGKAGSQELRQRGVLVGTAPEIAEQVQRLGEAGAERVMLQWLDLDDIHGLEEMARTLIP